MQPAEQNPAQAAKPTATVIPLPRRAPSRRDEREFLPAALEIIETPASPLGPGLDADLAPVGFAPPTDAPAYEVERTKAAMLAQAEQQRSKLRALDQQIAQKRAEADENGATIAKLEAGLPLLAETNEVRRKAMQ